MLPGTEYRADGTKATATEDAQTGTTNGALTSTPALPRWKRNCGREARLTIQAHRPRHDPRPLLQDVRHSLDAMHMRTGAARFGAARWF